VCEKGKWKPSSCFGVPYSAIFAQPHGVVWMAVLAHSFCCKIDVLLAASINQDMLPANLRAAEAPFFWHTGGIPLTKVGLWIRMSSNRINNSENGSQSSVAKNVVIMVLACCETAVIGVN
jgi:hypothetical protein